MKVGNKAASLIQMRELSLPVPDFFVLPTDHYHLFLESGRPVIPDPAKNLIKEKFDAAHTGTWAVRSSSTKEDGQNVSFAGLFETYLGLKSVVEVEEAIVKCWQSTRTERVAKYASKKNIDVNDIDMAVIVQKFIEPDCAGVLFTAHPLTGDDQEMFLEVCKGRGENLVSGHVTPDQWRISWRQPLKILEHRQNQGVEISEAILSQLQKMAQVLQAHYGCPQDIEFAVQNQKVFVVQSRPITQLQFAENDEEWTTADFRDGGVSSDVVSPLMWSLYEKIFASSLPEYFFKIKLAKRDFIQRTKWYKVFYGRPYWNLGAVKDIMSQVPQFNEKNFDEDMSIPITYEGVGRYTPFTVTGLIKVLPAVFGLEAEFKSQKARSEELLQNFHRIEKYYRSLELSKLSDEELGAAYEKLVLTDFTYVESQYFQTIYNASNAKMEFLAPLKKLQQVDNEIDYIKLISDLGTLEATQPGYELARIAKAHNSPSVKQAIDQIVERQGLIGWDQLSTLPEGLQKELREFTLRFYYHAERELDLRVPRWEEDLRFTLTTLAQLLATPPRTGQGGHKAEIYQGELGRMRAAFQKSWQRFLPGAWTGIWGKLERVRNFLKMREEIRCHSTKMYYFIRKMALEVAQRKLGPAERSFIFYVNYPMILELILGRISTAEFLKEAQQTRSYAEGYRNYKNPNEIGYRYNFIDQKLGSSSASGNRLKGIGCSAGLVRAKARVVFDIQEAKSLQSGEILVTRFTDPGWTPLFGLASGVVCENGGLLSHAALISREYGIPSVLNVKDATILIKNGQEIEVNGHRGEVALI